MVALVKGLNAKKIEQLTYLRDRLQDAISVKNSLE